MIYVKPLKEEDFLDSHGKFNETRQLKSREAEVGKNNVKLEKIKYLQSYIFVAGFGQVRAFSLIVPSPWSWSRKCERHSKQKNL